MIDRKKRFKDIKRQTTDLFLDGTILGIMRQEPRDNEQPMMIHSHLDLIRFSGQYNYKHLQEELGPFRVYDEFIPHEREPNYGTKLIRTYSNGIYLIIFVNPINDYFPFCFMEIHQKKTRDMKTLIIKNFLKYVARSFPKLNVSLVEYANDIYCWTPEDAMDLLDAIERHLYCPYLRAMPEMPLMESDTKREYEMNRVYRLSPLKAYTRGKNKNRRGKGWEKQYFDRVRIEHTAYRRHLLNHDIVTISDLLKNPKFFEANEKAYRFVEFKKSNILPKYYDEYGSDQRYPNSLQAELISHRKSETVKNIAQYISDIPHFSGLMSELHNQWHNFDREWADT